LNLEQRKGLNGQEPPFRDVIVLSDSGHSIRVRW